MAKRYKWVLTIEADTDQEHTDNQTVADNLIVASELAITKTTDTPNKKVTLTYETITQN